MDPQQHLAAQRRSFLNNVGEAFKRHLKMDSFLSCFPESIQLAAADSENPTSKKLHAAKNRFLRQAFDSTHKSVGAHVRRLRLDQAWTRIFVAGFEVDDLCLPASQHLRPAIVNTAELHEQLSDAISTEERLLTEISELEERLRAANVRIDVLARDAVSAVG